MKLLDLALSSLFVAGVQMPDDLAVGRVEKRDSQAVPIARPMKCPCRVSLRLLKHVLWIDANLLGLDNAEQHAVYEEGVIGRAVGCGKLLDSVTA
jgi:hypothetical protein